MVEGRDMGNRVGDAPVQSRGPALDAVNIDRVQDFNRNDLVR